MGDTNMCTDNPIILKKTLNSPTIICLQKRADKVIPSESDIIEANKLAFNDEIGEVTNRITEMIVRRDSFPVDSAEYAELTYRIMCGQHYQQVTIDRAKGIIAKSMPEYWYSQRGNIIKDGDTAEIIAKKTLNEKIAATKKPYFMCYVYPKLKSENNKYLKNNDKCATRRFGKYGILSVQDIRDYPDKTPEMIEFLEYFDKLSPVDNGVSTINRICWFFEDAFRDCLSNISYYMINVLQKPFDYTMLRSDAEYSRVGYEAVSKIYQDYKNRVKKYQSGADLKRSAAEENFVEYSLLISHIRNQCLQICPNEDELCNIVLDLCYQTEHSKQFAWDICGDIFVRNLIKHNDNIIHYPMVVDCAGEFEYCGHQFTMKQKALEVDYEEIDSYEGNPRQVS